MKKLYPVLIAAFLLVPLSLSAKEVVRLTRYAGETITGVNASHMFQVTLVKSNEARAVVEVDPDIEQFLRFERNSDGVVRVDMQVPRMEERRFQRNLDNFWKGKTLKLTLYLPEIESIRLSSMATLTTDDTFTGKNVNIRVESMGKLRNLDLRADSLDIRCEDMGSAIVTAQLSKLTARASGMGKIVLSGSADHGYAKSDDMGKIDGDRFHVRRGEIHAWSMGRSSLYVQETLILRSSDMGKANYKGSPSDIDIRTPRRTVRQNHTANR